MLEGLGIPDDRWLDVAGNRVSQCGRYQYRDEEVRLAVFDILVEGRAAHLVCNFLAKLGRTQRFALVKTKDEEIWRSSVNPAHSIRSHAPSIREPQRRVDFLE
jgi:hypothetical protein